MSETKHTPVPWAVHGTFRSYVVPACDVSKAIGGSNDPEREHRNYAKQICSEQGTDFPEFHRSRVTHEEAQANARLIVRAVNSFDDMLAALHKVAEHFGLSSESGEDWQESVWQVISKAECGQ